MSNARKFLLWSARVLGTLLLILVMVFALGEGLPDFSLLSDREIVLTLCLISMCAGVIAGYWKSWLAALLLILGAGTFTLLNSLFSPVPLVVLFLIDGILFLSSSCCNKQRAS